MIPWYKKIDNIRKVFFFESSCCTQELVNLFSSRYDPERLGFIRTKIIEQADIVIFNGYTSKYLMDILSSEYNKMEYKPLLISIGGCAIDKGPLDAPLNILPVSIYVPGCPPRPESIIDGLLKGISSI